MSVCVPVDVLTLFAPGSVVYFVPFTPTLTHPTGSTRNPPRSSTASDYGVCYFPTQSSAARDMFRVCMPEDLFAEFAPNHPNDAEVTQTERVFALLLMMREDGVSPVQETYR